MKILWFKKRYKMVILLILTIFLSACGNQVKRLSKATSELLDTTDILYSTAEGELGLYQLENEETKEIPIYLSRRFSYYKNSGNLIFHSYQPAHELGIINQRRVEVTSYNFDRCDMVSLINEGQSILYVTYKTLIEGGNKYEGDLVIAKYDGEENGEVVTLLINDENTLGINYCFLGTSIDYDGKIYYQDLLPTGEHALQQYDMENHELKTIFTTDLIMAPAISPNGNQIAFTKEDGLYVYDFHLGEIEKIVDIVWGSQFQWEAHNYYFSKYVPIAAWSPDGQAIIFSRLDPYLEENEEQYNIYMYSFETGEVNLIIENGYSPYWVLD